MSSARQASRPGSRRPDSATVWAAYSTTKPARTYWPNTERIQNLAAPVRRRTNADEISILVSLCLCVFVFKIRLCGSRKSGSPVSHHLLRQLPQRPIEDRQPRTRQSRRRTGFQFRGDLGKGRREAAKPVDAANRGSAAGQRDI